VGGHESDRACAFVRFWNNAEIASLTHFLPLLIIALALSTCAFARVRFLIASRAFPKFESYGMPETAAFREWKAKDAVEWFHGIGRLEVEKPDIPDRVRKQKGVSALFFSDFLFLFARAVRFVRKWGREPCRLRIASV
jgi:hypothetical protein